MIAVARRFMMEFFYKKVKSSVKTSGLPFRLDPSVVPNQHPTPRKTARRFRTPKRLDVCVCTRIERQLTRMMKGE
jgi:hypothetical protein